MRMQLVADTGEVLWSEDLLVGENLHAYEPEFKPAKCGHQELIGFSVLCTWDRWGSRKMDRYAAGSVR